MKHGLTLLLILACSAFPSRAADEYFPPSSFDTFRVGWYTPHLRAMNEPSLFEMRADRAAHVYRFLWLRTFHHPIAIRVDLGKAANGILTVKELSGAGGYEPGSIRFKTVVPLTAGEVSSFLSAVKDVGFWGMPTEPPPTDSIACDGAQWVLEGVHDGQYHVVDRWSPDPGPYRDLCLQLLAASKLALQVDDVY